jgi:hypothetical protein
LPIVLSLLSQLQLDLSHFKFHLIALLRLRGKCSLQLLKLSSAMVVEIFVRGGDKLDSLAELLLALLLGVYAVEVFHFVLNFEN